MLRRAFFRQIYFRAGPVGSVTLARLNLVRQKLACLILTRLAKG
jgi:hypothetical protein